jgi:tetraacyldisaccharide 4'-kinase
VAGRIAPWVSAAWQRRGLLAALLAPLSVVYLGVLALRRRAYGIGLLRAERPGVPIVVIGNLYVGGTGKTPLTIELVRALAARGRRPGVISRGYGRSDDRPRVVAVDAAPEDVGDEPLLIARATGRPVAVGARRAEAARALLAAHPTCDVLVADDGLQHLALARDVEIALLDARGLGNGWVLPAGPLREPPARLAQVDAIVRHGAAPPAPAAVPAFAMTTRLEGTLRRLDGQAEDHVTALAARQRQTGERVAAAAGIGVPQRFFDMLAAAGVRLDAVLPLPDHATFSADTFAALDADIVLITEKDAVKCARIEALRRDARLWVAPLAAHIDPALVDFVLARLAKAQDGSPAA